METLKDKRVLVVGLGLSGTAAARHCAIRGARVIAVDDKGAGELGESVGELSAQGVELRLGTSDLDLAHVFDLVVASPGVPLDHALLNRARERSVPIVGEMELAVREIERPVIAVTGTNGKTTTTALIGHLLEASGIRACVAGNIGRPIVGELSQAHSSDYVVLEVSSFQLDTTPSLQANIAVWLNVTEDHIDRHGSFEGYVSSKARLFRQIRAGGVGVYNACDKTVSKSVGASSARLIPFDAQSRGVAGRSGPAAWHEDGKLMVRIGEGVHEYPLAETRLEGPHNRENMLAAIVAAELAGADREKIYEGLTTFPGLPHRMEFVAEFAGVSFFDDSKGTNVGATMKALDNFERPVILIAGGLSKGADLTLLVPKVREKVKMAVLIGEAAGEMERLFYGITATARAGSMDDAVRAAAESAAPGDVVLLSPACASMDMFRDYNERGDAFKRAVEALEVKSS
jgi:UDP-N-acetylmuramoylalanine--D-glutamate ligase